MDPHWLARALEFAPIGLAVVDPTLPDTPAVYVNDAFVAMTGYSRDEAVGRNLRYLHGPGTDPAAIERIARAFRDGGEDTLDIVNYRKDGTFFRMKVRIRPVLNAVGGVEWVVLAMSDVTERLATEQAARESRERLEAIFEAAPLPLLTVHTDGTIASANAAAHQTLGVEAGKLVGRAAADFAMRDDPGAAQMREALAEGSPCDRIEVRARREDGRALWLLASARTGSFVGETKTLVAFQDVTDIKRREQELERANEEAERDIRARMRFLAAASHDLRQPLQALALFASALDAHVTTPQARSIVASIKASLRSMEEMFGSLLDMSKLDAGVMKAEPVPFSLIDLFEQLEATYGPQAEAAGIELRVVPSSLAVESDPRLLSRIVGNFLSNAVRYTRRGRILLGARLRGGTVRVEVCDTGPGIPESQRLEIFREFRQGGTRTSHGGGGVGLGLAIVRRLAALLAHRLDVRSVEGRGSCFAIECPLAEEWEKAVADEPGREPERRRFSGATVVVVDDDREIQEGLEMLLSEWGCRPVVAASAGEALDKLRGLGAVPDLVLADLHLVGRSTGVAAIEEIQARTASSAPAFLFTGDTEVAGDAEIPGGPAGFARYPVLRKPIDPERLRTVLADALGR